MKLETWNFLSISVSMVVIGMWNSFGIPPHNFEKKVKKGQFFKIKKIMNFHSFCNCGLVRGLREPRPYSKESPTCLWINWISKSKSPPCTRSPGPRPWKWSKFRLGKVGMWRNIFLAIFCVALHNKISRGMVGSVFGKISIHLKKVYVRGEFLTEG